MRRTRAGLTLVGSGALIGLMTAGRADSVGPAPLRPAETAAGRGFARAVLALANATEFPAITRPASFTGTSPQTRRSVC